MRGRFASLNRATMRDSSQDYLLPLLISGSFLVVVIGGMCRHLRLHMRSHRGEVGPNLALGALLAASVSLSVVGIWWGLPASWAIDEILPTDVLRAIRQGVSEGWLARYPPLHFYVLAVVALPFELLAPAELPDLSAESYSVLFGLMRFVSVIMAVATVYVTYRCALELFHDRVGALFSAALLATMPVFVFYSKTVHLDVPYLFWLSVSLLFYIRFVHHRQMGAAVAFAATAAVAICTKDQAYGFYVLPAAHVIVLRYRERRGIGIMRDPVLVAAGCTALVVLAIGQRWLFDISAFREHLRFLLGPGSQGFAQYEPGVAGHVRMAADVLMVLARTMTWPGFALCLVGIGGVIYRRDAGVLWILLPVVSYYLCFLAVIMYHYDRFLLGVCLVLVLFGGHSLAFLARTPRWGGVACALLLGYWGLHASLLNTAMVGDGRYLVEQWVTEHIAPGQTVATVGDRRALPRFNHHSPYALSERWPEIRRLRPDFVVINAAQTCQLRQDSVRWRFFERLTDQAFGYRRVYSSQAALPLPVLAPYPLRTGRCGTQFSNLSKINPPIEVFRRVGRARAARERRRRSPPR